MAKVRRLSRRWTDVARIRFRIENGGLAAIAQACAGPTLGEHELQRALADARIVHGIDAAALRAFVQRLADPAFAGNAVLARGDAPVHGTDGRVDGCADAGVVAGQLHDDGRIDFRERRFLVPIAEGTLLGTLVAPGPGKAGRDVLGQPVAAKPGKPHRMRLGVGTRVDGDRIVAARAGVLVRDERQLDVVALHTHGANVDYASGSLHTEGSLIVRGDVMAGFVAEARGDVHVTGSVLDGTVRTGGSARIDQGVLGPNANVRTLGSLACRHATAASLHADGALELFDQSAHCRLRGRTVRVTGGRGALVGGSVHAATRIQVRVAGTPGGAPTELVLGEDPAGETSRELRRELLAQATVDVSDVLHVGVRVTFGEQSWVAEKTWQHVRLRWSSEHGAILVEPLP
jgi:uncharacterized protein (DUF342 family)